MQATNKREQLLEVLEAFNIEVQEGSLLSRCAKCNGTFIPRCSLSHTNMAIRFSVSCMEWCH